MKVALVVESFYPFIGGVETIADSHAEYLAKRHDVKLITNSQKFNPRISKYNFRNYEVVELPGFSIRIYSSSLGAFPIVYPKLKYYLLKENFDVILIHSMFMPTPILAGYVALKNNIDYFIFNHSYIEFDPKRINFDFSLGSIINRFRAIIAKKTSSLYKKVWDNSRIIFTNSEITKKMLMKLNVDSKKIIVIPYGVNANKFKPKNKENEEKVILSVGRLEKGKGFDLLIKTLPKVKDSKLFIVGTGHEKNYLEKLTKKIKMEDRVHFLGDINPDNLPEIYNSANIFVAPSIYSESYGITIDEAMASGIPIIVGNCGGPSERIKNKTTGILVESGNIYQLTDALNTLLKDDNLRSEIGKNARKYVEENLDRNKIFKKIDEIINKSVQT
jgi:glycosyltransferase involved in cell wall biosynthesis